MAKISIVVPVYNESEAIKDTINDIKRELKKLKAYEFDIIVINDGSIDGTGRIVNSIKGIKVIENSSNKGYGFSIKSAIRQSPADYILIIDGDGTYPASSIPDLLKKSKQNDMVVGARIGKHVKIPFFRKPAKWILKHFAEYLTKTKVPDLNSGLRIFKKGIALRFINLFPDGFSFTTTLTMICLTNNYSVDYIPIDYYGRKGESSIKPLKDFFGFVNLIFRLTIFFKPLNVFMPISAVLFIGGVIKLVRDFLLLNQFGLGGSLLILTSLQIAFLGVLADLIIKRTTI